jgi:signal transduction histidine kinase
MPSYKNNRCYEAEEVTLIPRLYEIDHVQCSTHQQTARGSVHITDHSSPEQLVPNLSGLLLRTQDAERRRISRELHDSAGQNLAAIKLKLESARKKLNDRSEVGSELAECCDLVSECLKEIRTTSYLLHPPLLDELGPLPLGMPAEERAARLEKTPG